MKWFWLAQHRVVTVHQELNGCYLRTDAIKVNLRNECKVHLRGCFGQSTKSFYKAYEVSQKKTLQFHAATLKLASFINGKNRSWSFYCESGMIEWKTMVHILFNSDYYGILSKLVNLNHGSTLHDKQQTSLSALNYNAGMGNSKLALEEVTI